MLRVSGLTVAYGPILALRDADFEIDQGECLGIIGANGAGKSTLLNTVAGVVPAGSGSIEMQGRELLGLAPDEIVRAGVSLVPEGRRIFGTLTVLDNLRVGMTVLGPGRALEEEMIKEAVSVFPDLETLLHRPAGQLSGGQQQQLGIARALMSRPKVLLLDEPSLGLSPLLVDKLYETIASLRERGKTILLVEQIVRRTVEVADRVLLLRKGVLSEASETEIARFATMLTTGPPPGGEEG